MYSKELSVITWTPTQWLTSTHNSSIQYKTMVSCAVCVISPAAKKVCRAVLLERLVFGFSASSGKKKSPLSRPLVLSVTEILSGTIAMPAVVFAKTDFYVKCIFLGRSLQISNILSVKLNPRNLQSYMYSRTRSKKPKYDGSSKAAKVIKDLYIALEWRAQPCVDCTALCKGMCFLDKCVTVGNPNRAAKQGLRKNFSLK